LQKSLTKQKVQSLVLISFMPFLFVIILFLQPSKIKEIFLLKLKLKNQRSNVFCLNLKSY